MNKNTSTRRGDDMPYPSAFGRHRPCCFGRCMIAKVACGLNLAPLALVLSACVSAAHLVLVAPQLAQPVAPLPWRVVALCAVVVEPLLLLALALAYGTEPGLVPTRPAAVGKQLEVLEGPRRVPLSKYRAKFCPETENAVVRFDQYSPWVGNSVGRRNARYFVWFQLCWFQLFCFVAAGCAFWLSEFVSAASVVMTVARPAGGFWASGHAVAVAALGTVCAVAVSLLVGPLIYTLRTRVLRNVTLDEDLRYEFELAGNPYDRGAARNCCSVCCTSPGVSLCASGGLLMEDGLPQTYAWISDDLKSVGPLLEEQGADYEGAVFVPKEPDEADIEAIRMGREPAALYRNSRPIHAEVRS